MSKVIKMIGKKHFTLEMVELENGAYCIRFEHKEKTYFSEKVVDYRIASYLFDVKLQELEGN